MGKMINLRLDPLLWLWKKEVLFVVQAALTQAFLESNHLFDMLIRQSMYPAQCRDCQWSQFLRSSPPELPPSRSSQSSPAAGDVGNIFTHPPPLARPLALLSGSGSASDGAASASGPVDNFKLNILNP